MRLLPVLLLVMSLAARAQDAVPADDPLAEQQRLAGVLRRATADYEQGDYRQALTRLDALPGAAAGDLSVLNLRAATLTKAGEYEQAARIFEEILRANPDYFPAAFNAVSWARKSLSPPAYFWDATTSPPRAVKVLANTSARPTE